MEKATKATLLSLLVFPGAGHFVLKKYVFAIVLAGTTVVSLYILITKILERAYLIIDKVLAGEVQPDILTITKLVTQQATGNEAQLINIATIMLILVWLFSILDSYRIGRAQDRAAAGGH